MVPRVVLQGVPPAASSVVPPAGLLAVVQDRTMAQNSAARPKAAAQSFAALKVADLRDVDLRDVDLRDVDLKDVDLRAVDLRAVDLRAVDLRAVDLKDVACHPARRRWSDAGWNSTPTKMASSLPKS